MDSTSFWKQLSSAERGLLAGALGLFLVAGTLHHRLPMPSPNLTKQDTAVNVDKRLLVFLSAGNKRLITDLLWVQTLLESDIEHYRGDDLNSWMYLRFKTIAHLDPRFYENFNWGGQYLSIVKDDLQGAVDLLEEGVRNFPDDYQLHFLLGFTYYYELGDYRNGTRVLEKVMDHPQAPLFIKTLVNKMKLELGFDYDAGLALIASHLRSTRDEALREKLEKDYFALKAERDLKCLNAGKEGCEGRDAEGNAYVLRGRTYHSARAFVPYRLKRKGDNEVPRPVTTVK